METATEKTYLSPLTNEILNEKPKMAAKQKSSTDSVVVRREFGHEEMETMLTIEDDASLQDIIRKLEN
jgi:hypothetical protein